MERVMEFVDKANKSFRTADHLTYMTYPMVKDLKLLMSILESLGTCLYSGMQAILNYDRLYKRISPLVGNYDADFETFKVRCATRYNIPREHMLLMRDIRSIIEYRKQSPIEFQRKDKLVMCSENYKMKTVEYDKVKEYVNQTRIFVLKLNAIFKNVRR